MIVNNPYHKIQSVTKTPLPKKAECVQWGTEVFNTDDFAEHMLKGYSNHPMEGNRVYKHTKLEPEDIGFVEEMLRAAAIQYMQGCCLVRHKATQDIGIVYDVSYSANKIKNKDLGGLIFQRPDGKFYKVNIHVHVLIKDSLSTTWSIGNEHLEVLDDKYFSDYLRQYR